MPTSHVMMVPAGVVVRLPSLRTLPLANTQSVACAIPAPGPIAIPAPARASAAAAKHWLVRARIFVGAVERMLVPLVGEVDPGCRPKAFGVKVRFAVSCVESLDGTHPMLLILGYCQKTRSPLFARGHFDSCRVPHYSFRAHPSDRRMFVSVIGIGSRRRRLYFVY